MSGLTDRGQPEFVPRHSMTIQTVEFVQNRSAYERFVPMWTSAWILVLSPPRERPMA